MLFTLCKLKPTHAGVNLLFSNTAQKRMMLLRHREVGQDDQKGWTAVGWKGFVMQRITGLYGSKNRTLT